MLERNAVYLQRNMQQRKRFGKELYKGKEEQVIQRIEGPNQRKEYQNRGNQYRETNTGPEPIAVHGEEKRKGYRICFNCKGFRYIAQDCRSQKQRVKEERRIKQDESSKENRGQ